MSETKTGIDHLKCFDGIFLKRIAAPTCSRLYGIEPIGVGTPVVESLTSYLARVALAHCVTTGALIAKEIAPIINKPYLIDITLETVSSPFLLAARAMNGFGILATDWVNALQSLTSRQELRFLTMLPWKGLVARSKLLRKVRAWCPHCYQEWHEAATPLYDPLIWSLEPVIACLKHKRSLLYKCGHCNKHIPPLVRQLQTGFCPHCNQWLGVALDCTSSISEVLDGEQLRWQAWVFEHLGTIFATAEQLTSLPERGVVADLVFACVQKVTRGDLQAFVRRFRSFSQQAINQWRRGERLPELGRLMALCYQTNVSMKDVLLGKIGTDTILLKVDPVRNGNSYHVVTIELERMESALHSMLNENPPPSSNEVAKRLGCHVETYKRHFPKLFCIIRERYSTYEAERFNREKIKHSLLAAIDEHPPLSLSSIAQSLGCSPGFLREKFPEETSIIVERYLRFRQVFVDVKNVRDQLQAFQNESPPLSITQCAERLGCSCVHLYVYFPNACRAIGARYSDYRREKARQKNESRQQAIIKISMALEAEQVPANIYQIRKRLSHIKGLTNREIKAVLNGPSRGTGSST